MDSISDLINFAVNKQPIDFGNTLSNILGVKASQAVSGIREVIQKNLYNEVPVHEDLDEENLDERYKISKDEAHDILTRHGGADGNYFGLSASTVNSLSDEGRKKGYRHKDVTGKSYGRAFHDHLRKVASTKEG